MSKIAGMQIGTVTRPNVRQTGTFNDADTDSNSGSICFSAVSELFTHFGGHEFACGFSLEGIGDPPWLKPEHVALVGVRSMDPGEKQLVRELNRRQLLAVQKIAESNLAAGQVIARARHRASKLLA